MKNIDTILHARGESLFTDDITVPEGTLHGAVFSSPIAHGKITRINYSRAKQINGVAAIFTADDIPGENQIGIAIRDQPLFAEKKVSYIGQPIAVVIAKNAQTARKAVSAIEIEYEELPAIFDAKKAWEKNQLIEPPRTFSLGDIDKAWKQCDIIVEGEVESGGQEHFYLETQSAFAYPMENQGIKIISSTQAPSNVQRIVAGISNLAMHKIEVDVLRLGGGFGGKGEQATIFAAIAALGAFKLRKAVKLTLNRDEDMRITGKRHPYSSDFKIGINKEGKIIAYKVIFYQNAGAAADLSTEILGRSLFQATNSYFIPNVRATGFSCRTNLPPNNAMRAFGAPQSVFVIESAIFKASKKMGVSPLFNSGKKIF